MRRKKYKTPRFVTEMKAEVPPGRCILCEGIIVQTTGRKAVICHIWECQLGYWRLWKAERRFTDNDFRIRDNWLAAISRKKSRLRRVAKKPSPGQKTADL